MTRIEVVANQSVKPDLIEALQQAVPGISYTLWIGVQGRGGQGVRRGDAVWPERNVVYMAYVEDRSVRAVRDALTGLKGIFPREGITLFEIPGAREIPLSGQADPGQLDSGPLDPGQTGQR
ncbi:hypothetical protein SAMN05920897_110117 [Alkalispirochaeta americana]|uniref:Nitrogen regulatory protein P-II family n=1 Tax=Alkalispirochaeta americana TaxID=159291 RepID=A0A1N6TN50_9SPIO|nr:PG0541 family transporter-associated protein [Alkalispirochaeta americana]SIQ54677.1 hypothetical protein SAMN05920897_110117 [Alkalispirochaeta americana]